jgi:hypothetical protein
MDGWNTGGRHIASLAENRPFSPGTIMHLVDPGNTSIGVGIQAIQKILNILWIDTC